MESSALPDADKSNNQPENRKKMEGVTTAEVSFYFNKHDCFNLDKCPSISHNVCLTLFNQDIFASQIEKLYLLGQE
jgi:hypothetical protein